jgi:putative hemolysin
MSVSHPFLSRYQTRLTRDPADIRRAQQLRYAVFNEELGEGLATSGATGLDADVFDDQCDHLIIEERNQGQIVGTYRLQTGAMAAAGVGYYSAQEFDFRPYEPLRSQVVELGRACIHREHRGRAVLQLLWRGIWAYGMECGARYFLGCSSLTSQDPGVGWAAYEAIRGHHLARAELRTHPHPAYALPEVAPAPRGALSGLPRLFSAYLSLGSVVAGPPALDREFKTIDFLTLMDVRDLAGASLRHFLRLEAVPASPESAVILPAFKLV